MMIPITRKEKYINQIVGGGDTAPETPQTREEFFFAEILGEVIAPSPVTRVEKYLSAIAGQYSGDLPTPTTRTEYFLAKAAGMEIETPIPITREEMLWDTYIPIKTIEGIPPLTFKAKKAGTLKDYRIYGNTAGGESVGDLVAEGEHAGEYKVAVKVEGKNLAPWDKRWALNVDGLITANDTSYASIIDVHNIDYIYLFGAVNKLNSGIYRIGKSNILPEIGANTTRITSTGGLVNVSDCNYCLIACQLYGTSTTSQDLLNEFMITAGDTVPTKFEPYHAPVTVPIYLPEPIKMVGDEAEYIDYGEQKMHRIGADDIDVTLPALPVLPGTNTLTVGTEVQPSNVYIKYEEER